MKKKKYNQFFLLSRLRNESKLENETWKMFRNENKITNKKGYCENDTKITPRGVWN